LIERVTVHPRDDCVEIELQGEIVAMVEVALGSDAASATDSKTALRRLMLDDGSRRSVKVVAGTRNRLYRTRFQPSRTTDYLATSPSC